MTSQEEHDYVCQRLKSFRAAYSQLRPYASLARAVEIDKRLIKELNEIDERYLQRAKENLQRIG